MFFFEEIFNSCPHLAWRFIQDAGDAVMQQIHLRGVDTIVLALVVDIVPIVCCIMVGFGAEDATTHSIADCAGCKKSEFICCLDCFV